MKKIFVLLVIALLSVVLLACQPQVEEELEEVSLTVWASELDQDLTEELVDLFKTEYADEAVFTIEIGAVSEATTADQVLADLEAAADVFAFASDQFERLHTAGALQEVQENTAAIITANGGSNSGSIQAASKNGKLFAYPMTSDNGYFLYYDKSIYTEDDVKTLDAILDKAEDDGSKFTIQINNGWYLYSFFGGAGMPVAYDGTVNSVDWDNATGLNVAKSIIAMANHPGYINSTDQEFTAGVAAGTISAGVNGSWNAAAIQAAWGENYAATKLPTYTLNGQQVQMSSFSGYKFVGVNQTTDKPYWAMKLAEFLTNEASQIKRFEDRQLGPSNVNAAQSEAVLADPAISALAQQSAFAVVQNVGDNFWAPAEAFGNQIVLADLTTSSTNPQIQAALTAMVEGIEAAPAE